MDAQESLVQYHQSRIRIAPTDNLQKHSFLFKEQEIFGRY
jgi:hypothetical protein